MITHTPTVRQTGVLPVGGSGLGECWAIEPVAEGWAVYYSERGDRVQEHRFGKERDACRYLLGWILDDAVRPWD